MNKRNSETGITLIGFILVLAIIVAVVLLGFRMAPSYIEYYTVKKALEGAIEDTPSGNVAAIKQSFGRRLDVDYVNGISAQDLNLTREGGAVVGSIAWEKRLPIVYNVSILLDFDLRVVRKPRLYAITGSATGLQLSRSGAIGTGADASQLWRAAQRAAGIRRRRGVELRDRR
jgi:hypothetical protein